MASSTLRSDAPCPFQSALLLTDDENKVFADRTALRSAGVRHFRVISSGVEAALYLAERVSTIIYPVTEIIVCLPNLSDMNQAEFASLVRSHPLLPHMPLLAITTHRGNESMLHKAGYDAVLPRPFNTNTLCAALHAVGNKSRLTRATLIDTLKRNRAIPGHEEFDEQLKKYIPPDKERMTGIECYQYGKQLLVAQHFDLALPYLQKAATDPASKGEACLALAILWREKRDYDKVKICLFSALKGFMDTGAWPQALALTKKLVKEYPFVPHPLLHELERRLRQGKTAEAITMLPHVLGGLPHDEIAPTLLRGAQASQVPEGSLAELLTLMEQSEHPDLLALREELVSLLPPEEPVKTRWFNRLLSRESTRSAPPGAANASSPSLAERRGIPLAEVPEQSLLPVPPEFSLVDEEVRVADIGKTLSSEFAKDFPQDDDTPPPLILPAPDNFAKPVSLVDDAKRNKTREKSDRPVNPTYGEPVLSLMDEDDPHMENGLRPSLLGDAWTMVRGTMRLYRSSK